MKVAIVIPTYNEAENIAPLLEELRKATEELEGLGMEIGLFFVDDNSPDLTYMRIEEAARGWPAIRLLRRNGRLGLGSAYLEGFKQALAWGAEAVVQMDADLQHPPQLVPSLLRTLLGGFDVVVASRYVEGGRWASGGPRELLSRAGNLLLSYRFRLGIRDVTSGYRALRREAVASLLSAGGLSRGFRFQLDQTKLLKRLGFRIVELSYTMGMRAKGSSKFSPRELMPYLWSLLRP
ncbi:MAG: dolichol-phosphate mannosyltransferase [Nitrososphaerota archaeon]